MSVDHPGLFIQRQIPGWWPSRSRLSLIDPKPPFIGACLWYAHTRISGDSIKVRPQSKGCHIMCAMDTPAYPYVGQR